MRLIIMESTRTNCSSTHCILNSILSNVSALSEALNNDNTNTALQENQQNSNASVEGEVSSIFGRPTRMTRVDHANSSTPSLPNQGGIVRAIGRHTFRPPITAGTFPLAGRGRQIQRAAQQHQFPKRSGKKVSQQESTKCNKGPLFVDIVLLQGPNYKVVPMSTDTGP